MKNPAPTKEEIEALLRADTSPMLTLKDIVQLKAWYQEDRSIYSRYVMGQWKQDEKKQSPIEQSYECVMKTPKRGIVLKSKELHVTYDLVTVQNFSVNSKGKKIPGNILVEFPVNVRSDS